MFRWCRIERLANRSPGRKAAIGEARYFGNSPCTLRRDRKIRQPVEQIIHMVDLMRYLMGDAVSVYSRQEIFSIVVADYTVEDERDNLWLRAERWVHPRHERRDPRKWINDAARLTKLTPNSPTRTMHYSISPPKRLFGPRPLAARKMCILVNYKTC
jgi:hypothetical protein